MERNDELKEIDIRNHMCYYFDNIMRLENFDFDIFLDEKSYEKILHNAIILIKSLFKKNENHYYYTTF